MAHPTLLHILATIVIIGSLFIWVVDFLVELDIYAAVRIKWSLPWTLTRYVASVCAVLLSLDILWPHGQ